MRRNSYAYIEPDTLWFDVIVAAVVLAVMTMALLSLDSRATGDPEALGWRVLQLQREAAERPDCGDDWRPQKSDTGAKKIALRY